MLKTNNNPNLIFIHANGFPPNSYSELLKNFKNDFRINNFLLRPLWNSKENHKIVKDWRIFHNDFIKSLNNIDDIIGMGHSIGGNIILRSALTHPNKFSKIVLLDPTLFIPKIILGWRFFSKLGLQKKIHPWINSTLKRKMIYNNNDEIFKSYRRKKVFSKIKDENLRIYINSITKESDKKTTNIVTKLKKLEKHIQSTHSLYRACSEVLHPNHFPFSSNTIPRIRMDQNSNPRINGYDFSDNDNRDLYRFKEFVSIVIAERLISFNSENNKYIKQKIDKLDKLHKRISKLVLPIARDYLSSTLKFSDVFMQEFSCPCGSKISFVTCCGGNMRISKSDIKLAKGLIKQKPKLNG